MKTPLEHDGNGKIVLKLNKPNARAITAWLLLIVMIVGGIYVSVNAYNAVKDSVKTSKSNKARIDSLEINVQAEQAANSFLLKRILRIIDSANADTTIEEAEAIKKAVQDTIKEQNSKE